MITQQLTALCRQWCRGTASGLCCLLLLSPLPGLTDTHEDDSQAPTTSPASPPEGHPQPVLPGITVSVDGVALNVEVAASAAQRYMGLSFRRALADNAGMLFVYDRERPLTFTMRNTLLPLSIAFISDAMVITDIQTMDVGPGQLFDSAGPARYALEVNQGWFKRHGIEVGAQLTLQ